jgi:Asp-tRNA(Asn)/Glu-tRNA(Gln) amidotransferase A subunit family amidase
MVNTPLSQAMEQLHAVIREVELRQEQDLPIDELVVPFHDASVSLQQAVDRRVWVLKQLQSSIEQARKSAQFWSAKARYLETALAHLEEQTIEVVKDEAQGLNSRIKVCLSGGKQAVKFKDDTQPVAIARVVEPKNYPTEYLEKKEVYVLKSDFEDDLRQGKVESEAAYVAARKKHLRLS